MTPNTRQHKSRSAMKHSNFLKELKFGNEKINLVDVVLLSLENLGLYEDLKKKDE